MSTTGWVFDIQRFSIHDGPGIRTTVFLKGCPLRCIWCHNPEGLERQPQIRLAANLCMRCGRCVQVCEVGGHEVTAEGHNLHLEACRRCGRCVEVCPPGAVEMVGKRMTAAEVLDIVLRDLPFYQQSGGGVTLSGGEPLAQFAFTRKLLTAAKAEDLHTAIETSAYGSWKQMQELAPLTDYWIVDIKHTNPRRHRELTGVPNRRILSNFRKMMEAKWPLLLRIPWIPGHNAEDSFLTGLVRLLTSMPEPPTVEFMLYHRLGLSKWSALGAHSPFPDDIAAATWEDVQPWVKRLRQVGIKVKSDAVSK